ncbi:MAG: hypothetical protein JO157_12800 [Acetobacteraceae bacterium]|nr:hypothetical protein [Acetobacteraceae bacterium]
MTSEAPAAPLALPAALIAEINAVAEDEHRPVAAVLEDALKRYVRENRLVEGGRIARKVSELSEAELEAIANTEMDPRHDDLDSELASAILISQEAVARIFELRKANHLPEGVTIRDLMTHGRA